MKIFVVDDNPHVLALMERSLAGHGEVQAYQNAGDAFMRAVDSPPDLIVSDYRMKGFNGRELLEKVRGRAETKGVSFILVASKSDIEEQLQGVADQVDEFVSKPFFSKDLVKRVKRTLDKAFLAKRQSESASAGSGNIRGRLSEMNIMDLFQSMEMGAKSCLMTVTDASGAESALLYFGEGQVYHCVCGNVKGDAVVNKIAKWPEGTFEINFSAPKAPDTNTTTGTQGLLMEAMRLMDEDNR